MRISTILCATLAAMVCLSSCNKEEKGGKYNDGKKHVYIAGDYNDKAVTNKSIACYWVDGVRTDLADADNGQTGFNNMYVDDKGNVYVLGYYKSFEHACYWMNGKQVRLESEPTSGNGQATDILFVDHHMIISGNDNRQACIWIDGKKLQLCSDGYSIVHALAWTSEGLVCEGYQTADYSTKNPRKWVLGTLTSSPISALTTLEETVTKFVKKGEILYARTENGVYDYYGKKLLTAKPSGSKLYDFAITEDGKVAYTAMDRYFCGKLYVDNNEVSVCDLSEFSYSRLTSVAVSDGGYYISAYLGDDTTAKPYFIGPDKKIVELPVPDGSDSCSPDVIIVK